MIVYQAHSDAIEGVMRAIEFEIGRARKGDVGRVGYDAGARSWLSFDHYAARPTVEVVRHDSEGQPMTELHRLTGTAARVPGDMQVHTGNLITGQNPASAEKAAAFVLQPLRDVAAAA
jgi:hypothetical protein